MTRWLAFAAAPAFTIMALVTVSQEGGMPFCSAGDALSLSGMAPMYLLMAVFHSAPWLKAISRQRGVTLFQTLNRSGDGQTMEQKP
jgi:hypothetical protein